MKPRKDYTVKDIRAAMRRCDVPGSKNVNKNNKSYYLKKLNERHCDIKSKHARVVFALEMIVFAMVVGLLLLGFEYFSTNGMWLAVFFMAIGVGVLIPFLDDFYLKRRAKLG